jgi:hypothetical protein
MTGFNQHVFDDGSFKVNQYTVLGNDPVIHFGPLKAHLSELFFMGFTLQATGWVKKHQGYSCKVHLIRGREKYLVGKISSHLVIKPNTSLQSVIKEGQQMLGKMSEDQYDPFEQLERKYPPITRKKCLMVGNQTLQQYVSSL